VTVGVAQNLGFALNQLQLFAFTAGFQLCLLQHLAGAVDVTAPCQQLPTPDLGIDIRLARFDLFQPFQCAIDIVALFGDLRQQEQGLSRFPFIFRLPLPVLPGNV